MALASGAPTIGQGPSRVTLAVHTPGMTPSDQLRTFTVGREAELQALRDSLHAAATSNNRNHVLVQGPRGSGKTHLLTLAAHLARTDPELSARLLVAQLPEDAYRVTDYPELLAETIEAAGSTSRTRDPRELEHELVDLAGGRVVVVIVENLHRLFSLLGEQGQRELRAFVQNSEQVLLLGSTPSLVEDLSDHGMPFYGFFNSLRLSELDPERGRELLLRLAKLDGDEELGMFLASDTGLARLRAVAALTGGSPRLWLLLAGCMTVERLDEVVPLFVEVLDKLGPYYKARLEDLSPDRAKLVSHLCTTRGLDGRVVLVGGRTVKELASDTGVTQQSASKQLTELQRLGYVSSEKARGSDQRGTFYRVREPMLAHWLAMKERQQEPQEVVVRMLRAWYATPDLRQALARSPAGSVSESHIGAALAIDAHTGGPQHGVELLDVASVDDLLVAARRVIANTSQAEGLLTSPTVAIAAECVALTVIEGRDAAASAAQSRLTLVGPAIRADLAAVLDGAMAAAAAARTDQEGAYGPATPPGASHAVAVGFEAAADRAVGALPADDLANLAILAADWTHEDRRTDAALERVRRLHAHPPAGISDRTRLAIRAELASLEWGSGDHESARRRGEACLQERDRLLGPDHPDTLAVRANIASWTGEAGDPAAAQDLYAALIDDATAAFGPDHPNALASRMDLAKWTGEAGDLETARDVLQNLIRDSSRILGPTDPRTVTARGRLGLLAAEAGDLDECVTIALDLLADGDSLREPEADPHQHEHEAARLAARVARGLLEAPTEGRRPAGRGLRGYLREVPDKFKALLTVHLVATATTDRPEHAGWLLAEYRAAEELLLLSLAVLGSLRASSAQDEQVLPFIKRWEEHAARKDDPALLLLGRQLAAIRAAVFDGDHEPLVRLPGTESALAREVIDALTDDRAAQ